MCSTVSVAFETFFCLIFKLFIAFLSLLLFDFAKTKSLQMNISMFFGWCFLNDKFSFSLLNFSQTCFLSLCIILSDFSAVKKPLSNWFSVKKMLFFFFVSLSEQLIKAYCDWKHSEFSPPTRATNREGW